MLYFFGQCILQYLVSLRCAGVTEQMKESPSIGNNQRAFCVVLENIWLCLTRQLSADRRALDLVEFRPLSCTPDLWYQTDVIVAQSVPEVGVPN